MKGICYLVGAGPGDPGLLTLRGRDCLGRADVVVYDALANSELLDFAPEAAERVCVGKRCNRHIAEQDAINARLVKETKSGKCVVRLKGGDPFIFGRGGEEAAALTAAGCTWEVVPGVTSAAAAPAYAGIPVTHRGMVTSVTFFSGHAEVLNYAGLMASRATLVMLMGIEHFAKHCAGFLAAGMPADTPVAIIENGTLPNQRVFAGTLAEMTSQEIQTPAVVVFGAVASLRDTLEWLEKKPLFGKRIAVTRTRKQGSELVARLHELGADAYEMPTIRIEPAPNKREFYEMVMDAHSYSWIIFTSPNGVDTFFRAFYEMYQDARSIGGVRIAVIGEATAARLKHWHLAVDLMPEQALAENLVAAIKKECTVENEKFLLVQAANARDVILASLNEAGGIVDQARAYITVPETADVAGGIQRFIEEGADIVTFTSASTAENFAALGLTLPAQTQTASIGPVTSAALKKCGLPVSLQAKKHDIEGLIEAILKG